MHVYGLTGGIGAGKSEAAREFAARGIPAIDADRLGHELIAPGGAAEEEVRRAFGEEILTDGAIDREKLGAMVFGRPEARLRLNQILHPRIRAEVARRCAELGEQGHAAVLVEAALLAESGQRDPFLEGLILITANEETRIRRLAQQRGMAPEEARRRIAAQTPPEQKRPLADWVIENNGSREALARQVAAVAADIKRQAREAQA